MPRRRDAEAYICKHARQKIYVVEYCEKEASTVSQVDVLLSSTHLSHIKVKRPVPPCEKGWQTMSMMETQVKIG